MSRPQTATRRTSDAREQGGNQNKISGPRRSIYASNGERIGDVQELDGKYIARDRAGTVIDAFDVMQDAIGAITDQATLVAYTDAFRKLCNDVMRRTSEQRRSTREDDEHD
jgi:hypothetical protein